MLRRNMVTFEIHQNLADADRNGTPDGQFSEASIGAFRMSSGTGVLLRRQTREQSTPMQAVFAQFHFYCRKSPPAFPKPAIFAL
jgi:hypothetical protein